MLARVAGLERAEDADRSIAHGEGMRRLASVATLRLGAVNHCTPSVASAAAMQVEQ